MKTRQSTGYCQQASLRLLLCLVSSFFFVTSAFALTGNLITDCFDCHGSAIDMRPIDTPAASLSSYRNITTGAFKGNHRTHMAVAVPGTPAASSGAACTKCHGNTVGYTPKGIDHRSGVINFNSNINSSPTAALYGGITFKNQTSVPVLTTCTNVNCHFQTTTPTWGSAPFSYTNPTTNDCAKCHGNGSTLAAPQDRSHPGMGKHGTYYGTNTASCAKCHPNYTTFSHSTSARTGGRNLSLQGTDLAPANYSLPANLAYPAYITNAAASRNGTCTNLYCHSDGTKAVAPFASTAVPTWGVNTLTCANCHGYKVGSAAVLTTGSHTAHINSAAAGGRTGENFSCDQCHKATTSDGATISTLANHVNKAINVNMTSSSVGLYTTNGHAPGGALGSCSNTTCHNVGRAGTVGGAAAATVTWNTVAGANKCAICHGGGNAVGSPDYTSGTAGSATANSHNTHAITKGINCSVCHIQTTTTGTAIIAGGGKHLDGSNQDVSFGTFNGQAQGSATYTPGATFKSCVNTYCHSSGIPQWGAARLNCRGCHGGDAASSSPIATGKHTAHTNPFLNTSLGQGNGFQCATCHAKTITTFANNTTIGNQANHVDGMVDYSGVRAGGSARYSTTTKSCTNIYCHSNGNPGAIVFVSMTGSKTWTGPASFNCNGCHGRSNPTTGAPDYVSGGAAPNATANSHNKHVAGTGMIDTKGCANCHAKTISQTTAGAFKDYTAANYHLNGTPNLFFKNIGGKTGTWNGSATGTCNNTYCHGAAASAPWGQLTSLACNACHSADNTLPGAHKIHIAAGSPLATKYTTMSGNASTSGAYRFSCAACHSPLKGAQHANGPQIGGNNGPAEVFYGFTSATLKGGAYNYGASSAGTDPTGSFSYTAGGNTLGSCNNTYCHSNGQGNNGLATVAWDTAASSGTCVQCHDTKKTGAATALSGKHDAHMNTTTNASLGLGNGLNCIDCHAKTVKTSNNTVVDDKTKHVNKMVDYSSTHGGGSARYNSGTKTCTSIYCHSNGNSGAILYVNPGTWTAGASLSCNGCHGASNPTTGAPDYPNGGAVPSTTANSHSRHVSVLNITTTTGCSICHVKTADKTVVNKFKDYSAAKYHLNGTSNVIFNTALAGNSAAYVPATGACNLVTCHSNGKGGYAVAPIWGQTTNCGYCHPIASLSATHAKHIDITQTPAFYSYTANRSSGNDATGKYKFGCSNCHPLVNNLHTSGTVLIDFRPSIAGVGTLRVKNNAAITAGAVVAGSAASGTTGTPGTTVKCLNIYCHSNGYTTTPVYATTPDWYGGLFTGDRCANCHGNSPNSTIAGSKSHYNTRFLGYTGTAGGHQIGIHAMKIYSSPSGLAKAGTSGRSSHGNAGTSTTISCNICHYATLTTARNDRNVVCNTCHISGNTVGAQFGNLAAIADKSKHVNGNVNVTFMPVSILSKAQIRTASFNLSPYSSAWKRNVGYKASGAFDSAKGALNTSTMWNSPAKTCSNVACHNGQSVKWSDNDGTTSCISCHNTL